MAGEEGFDLNCGSGLGQFGISESSFARLALFGFLLRTVG